MTQTSYSAPRLERPRDSAFKGVCTAVARATGTDPILWRVLALGLCFFGGLGFVLYLVGIVAIPAEDQPTSLAERVIKGPDRQITTSQSLLLALVVLSIGAFFLDDSNDGLLVGAVVGALGLLWWRERAARPASPMPSATGLSDAVAAPADADSVPSPPLPVWHPSPPRPRSPLGGLTISVAVLVSGVLLLVGASGAASVPAEVVLAAALTTVGVGLVIGSFFGRAPGLIALAVALGLTLGATAGARPAIEAGIGERTWTPAGSATYRLGIGEATLDLRSLPTSSDPLDITARVDVGHLLVLVPDNVRVSLDARAGHGEVLIFGVEDNGRRVERHVDDGPTDVQPITLALSVRIGMVEVRRD